MMWLWIVLLGHLSNAGAFVVDKILLTKKLPQPALYAFYIGLLNIFSVLMLPWAGFYIPPPYVITQCAISGATFVGALLCFFSAIKDGETSRVVPFVGGLIPIFTFAFARTFLGEHLIGWQWFGILFLILGAVLISYERSTGRTISSAEVAKVALAALLFALSFTLTKSIFRDTTFLNGLIWKSIFSFLTSLSLLLLPDVRLAVLGGQDNSQKPNLLFFAGQLMGGAGFLLLAGAIKLAPSVTVVNALQGVQYGFLFLLILAMSRLAPGLISENPTRPQIYQKTVAIACLAVGLILAA